MRLASFLRTATCLLLFLCASERAAFAQASAPASSPPLLTPQDDASLWQPNWPEFSTAEGVATLVAGAGTGIIVLAGPSKHPRWTGPILFDRAVRDELRGSESTRRHTRTIGDYTYHLSPLLPVIDVLIVSALARSDSKLAKNLGLMMLEAYSYSGLSAFITTEISARARPDAQCQRRDCTADTQSFFSGHAAISATGAGLVCANHSRIALYGASWADAAICALSAANALTTATTRVIADRHYASDVILGTGVGFGFGYAVPVLLHYSRAGNRLAVGPDALCGSSCIGVSGTF